MDDASGSSWVIDEDCIGWGSIYICGMGLGDGVCNIFDNSLWMVVIMDVLIFRVNISIINIVINDGAIMCFR